MRRALSLAASIALVSVAGCDQLFPELTGKPADLAGAPDGGADLGPSTLRGQVCVMGDLRAPSSCRNLAPGRRVTIEENRAAALVAADGSFALPLDGIVDRATLAVSDGPGMVGRSAPTISFLEGAALAGARASGVLLPSVDALQISQLAFDNGAAEDPTRGAIVAWVLDPTGAAVRGAEAARITGALGPLYDSAAVGGITEGVSSGAFGTLAFLDLPPGEVTITVGVPGDALVTGDSFALPVRSGAITLSALRLPAR